MADLWNNPESEYLKTKCLNGDDQCAKQEDKATLGRYSNTDESQ